MSNLKTRIMTLCIKGEMLSCGRALPGWGFWWACYAILLPVQWVTFNAPDWAYYFEVREIVFEDFRKMLDKCQEEATRE